jgi:hypothetical protein
VSQALRLRAEDGEDLQVVSAVLQDALVPVKEMEFLAKDHCFALVASRFRWENCSETAESPMRPDLEQEGAGGPKDEFPDVAFAPCSAYERVNCGVRFEGVRQVRCRGFDRRDRGQILELLAIEAEPGAVVLVFSGGAAIRLEGTGVTCRMEDLGEPWPTHWRPRHPLTDSA